MKKFKSLIAIAIVTALTLSACSNSNSSKKKDKDESDETDSGNNRIEISVETQPSVEETIVGDDSDNDFVDDSSVLVQAYYDYLSNTLIPEHGISDIDNSLVISFGSGNFHQQSDFQSKYGLLSADVRDYNGDGVLDMVTYSVSDMPSECTSTGVVMANRWSGYAENFLSITARFYTIENGEIALKDQVNSITELSGDSIGTLIYGVYDDEGSVYIYGNCDTETPETYGPRKTNIYHVEGDSFVFDATQGFYGFGQASVDGDPNVIAGTRNVDFAPTGMGTALTHVSVQVFDDPGVACSGSVLGGVRIGYYETMSNVQVTLYDFSLMRNVLNNGIAELDSRVPMPVFEAPVNIIPEDEANALVARISANTGIDFSFEELTLIDGGGSFFKYVTGSGVAFTIRYSADGVLEYLGSTYPYIDPCEDWYTIKDAVFTDAQLNIDPSLYSTFLGHCEWNQTSQNSDTQSIVVARMDDCFWTVSFR